MLDPAFKAPGRFYRGNLHTHSDRSDGILDPFEVCKRYRDEGYDFISLTDHFIGEYGYPITDTVPYRDNHFTTLLGAELHSGAMANGDLWHILAVGLPSDFEPSNSPGFKPVDNQESGAEIAMRAREAGAYIAIPHPQWSGLSMEDARLIQAAHAVEIYNHASATGNDRGNGFHVLDLLLEEGRRLDLCATDDAHFGRDDHFGGWVMVKSEANEPELLLDALKRGHYYSSQGPEFHLIEWTKSEVTVECSPCTTVIVQGQKSYSLSTYGKSITRATIKVDRLSDLSPWMRVTLIDEAKNRAWSNPVWCADIP